VRELRTDLAAEIAAEMNRMSRAIQLAMALQCKVDRNT